MHRRPISNGLHLWQLTMLRSGRCAVAGFQCSWHPHRHFVSSWHGCAPLLQRRRAPTGTVPSHNMLSLVLCRPLSVPSQQLFEKESSKVEGTVKALKEAEPSRVAAKPDTSAAPVPVPPKRPLVKRIWDELVHYYHGFRLLFIDIRVSSRLVYRVLNGDELSRREHKQLVRTVSDLFRLLPFSVFIIVPFMEFLLPVALKLFPGMLPSTFQTTSDKDAKVKKELKVKLEMAKFLQNTLDEMAVKKRGETHSHSAKEFAEFCEKIRESGEDTTNEEILKFSKLFEDEITLDSLTRPQLTALCRLLELQPIGTNNFLRFQLRMKLRSLKADDQMIYKEGIDSLTVTELQAASRARGMRAMGLPESKLRYQLAQWLDLSLNENIPPSLLLLSRAMLLSEALPPTEQLKATISTLPKEAVTEAKYKIGEREGKVDNRTKIEIIQQEEEAIKKEKEENEVAVESEKLKSIGQKHEEEIKEILEDKAAVITQLDEDMEKKPPEPKKEELSKADLADIEDALEKIAAEKQELLIEKEELEDLKEEMADYKQDVEELKDVAVKTGKRDIQETKAAMRLYSRVNRIIGSMDHLIDKLNEERKSMQIKLDSSEGAASQKTKHNLIEINDLLLAMRRIQKSSNDTRLEMITDLLDTLDIDHDGAVKIDHVLKVIDTLGRENVKVSPAQMKEIIELLIKEEVLQAKNKEQQAASTDGAAQPPSSNHHEQQQENKNT
ncbi:mitochondrial proton/calcium exchanger protein-like [Dermacentor andersoni]|uniref:mitochondrial proton/calcium exchanger protein-like n=1 Tax=Dermacentor andersoni TaxID=34620 RepID=UPI0021557514|nr:mitochondrial proton/calcium exchanger protein-like [Dermacentor andersoni]